LGRDRNLTLSVNASGLVLATSRLLQCNVPDRCVALRKRSQKIRREQSCKSNLLVVKFKVKAKINYVNISLCLWALDESCRLRNIFQRRAKKRALWIDKPRLRLRQKPKSRLTK
jgi:hypothetical protein